MFKVNWVWNGVETAHIAGSSSSMDAGCFKTQLVLTNVYVDAVKVSFHANLPPLKMVIPS